MFRSLQPPSLQQPVLRLPPGLAVGLAAAAAAGRALHTVHGAIAPPRPQRSRGPEARVCLQR